MSLLNQAWQNLYGAGLLAFFRADGMLLVNQSQRAARQSFALLLLAVPGFILFQLPGANKAAAQGTYSPAEILAALLAVSLVSLLLQLLFIHRAARQLKRGAHFPQYVTASNAAAVITSLILLTTHYLSSWLIAEDSASAKMFDFTIQSYVIAYSCFITQLALRLNFFPALLLTAMQFFIFLFTQLAFTLLISFGRALEAT